MPVVFGPFETSLRGGDSPNLDRRVLHKGCCGNIHGSGVKKEKSLREVPRVSKTCFLHSISCEHESTSSDESCLAHQHHQAIQRRSQSSETPSIRIQSVSSHTSSSNQQQRRSASSNAEVAHRLFSSPTKATTAKVRAERTSSDSHKMLHDMRRLESSAHISYSANNLHKKVSGSGDPADQDSGHFSSDTDCPARKTSQNQATSDDELSIEELRRRQRKERRDYIQRHSPIKSGSNRKESPSPAGPRFSGERGRRSSDEMTSDTSVSPPPTPSPKTARSTSSRTWDYSPGGTLLSRRTKSSGNTPKKFQLGVKTCPYAFGSSQRRFFDEVNSSTNSINGSAPLPPISSPDVSHSKRPFIFNSPNSTLKRPAPLNKSSSDGVQNANLKLIQDLARTTSETKVSSRRKEIIDQTRESWLKFKDDVESALQKKPNQAGFYKNLSDMMHNKLEMLTQAKTEEQVASEQAFLDAERVWLVHKEGFAAAGQLHDDENPTPEGKVRVQLDYNGDIIEVDEDDVEKANPPNFDTVEDLAQLRFLNESSVLHTLRLRYGNNLIHTYAGPTIITINPMSPLAIYSEKVIHMFKDCKLEDMPPHIYSVANSAYRTMLRTRKDQSIIFIGRSGSGKTSNLKHTLSCLALTSASSKISKKQVLPPLTSEKVSAMCLLLEAFGNSRTVLNANATRFTQLISIDYDVGGQIVSASVQAMMLEKNRVVRRPEGEPNFNIFYLMLSGLDPKVKRELNLENLSEPNLFMTPLQRIEDKAKASANWSRIVSATKTLGISSQESNSLWSVLAAIYHLGVASVSRGNMGKTQFGRPQSAQRAAMCLGTTVEELARTIFQGAPSLTTLNRKLRSTDGDSVNLPDGVASLEGFVISLYQEVFNTVVFLINRSISTTSNHVSTTVMVLDTPGFQNPSSCGRLLGASFEDLCHNYVQERLQLMFHERTITNLHEKYLQEQVDCELGDIEELTTPAPLIALIDKQGGLRYSQSDLSNPDKRGLLWILDEEAIYPGATDESFVERLLAQYSQRGSQDLIKKGPGEKQFVLQHHQGTNPVLYNADGWLQASREDGTLKAAAYLLQESGHKNISDLFYTSRGPVSVSVTGSVAGMEGSHALRRTSSIRRAFTSRGQAGIKRNSVALQIKFQVDGLCEQLRRSKSHFVHCFLPQHNAGLCDVKGSGLLSRQPQSSEEILMNVPLVRSQLRGAQILDAVRLHKNGFPESLTYADFWRRYRILAEDEAVQKTLPGSNEVRLSVEALLQELDLDKSAARLGNTQVFLRSGVLIHLDEERELRLTDQVVQLQAMCRGYLARRHAKKLKVQNIALKCIQKNVRKFMGVREWPWWRLLIKITPMLNVHRTEDQLRLKTDELESLRARFEKIEKERNDLKTANERLESNLSEMTNDLAEEHSTAMLASERLEAEQAERMKLEKEKAELEHLNKQLHSTAERMEMELLYSRAIDLNGSADYSDSEGDSSIYKQKYERAMKEIAILKQRLNRQHEDDMEQLLAMKKQLEKKLNDAYEEVDEQRQIVAQWKRKAQKIQGEMNDSKLLLEEQTSRNALLEKRQRKFDAELGMLQDDRKVEAATREKIQRELDAVKSFKYQLEDEIQGLKMDLDYKNDRIQNLTRELDDFQSGGATEEEVANLKRQKHELDMKLKEEEEVIDDLAGQIQMLEQSKIKLEMSTAAMMKEHKRELAQKDEELEDVRAAFQKKLKIVEQQLENEHEDRLNFLREKHELETKIITLQELAARSADEEQVYKLKRDLKRTKALLRDAQFMLEKSKLDSSNKVIIRQLKNQLEDAEFAKVAAVKGKQNVELELSDVQTQLDDVLRSKSEMDDRIHRINREKADLGSQLDDAEEELQEVMKRYKAAVAQLSIDQITLQEQANRISDIEEEKNKLKEQNSELAIRIDCLEDDNIVNPQQSRLELKVRELESKLELEQTTRTRMESQISRLKEAVEKINNECDLLRSKELVTQDISRKLQRQLRELREDYATVQQKETEANAKKNELEKQLELAEAETLLAKNDLKLAMKRIEDLQTAINGDLDSESESFQSDGESETSEDGMDNYRDSGRGPLGRDIEARATALSSTIRTLETMQEEVEEK